MLSLPEMKCAKCGLSPSELEEFKIMAEEVGMTPDQVCYEEEGTLDETTGKFLCTTCYIAVGMPSGRNVRWIASKQNLRELGL